MPEQDVERCRQIARKLDTEIQNAIILEAMLELANEDDELRVALDDTYEAHAYNAIHNAIIGQLIMTLSRMFDSPGSDRASIPALARLIRNEECKAVAIQNAIIRHQGVDPFGEEAANYSARAISDAVAKFDAIDQAVLQRIRNFRDRFLGHNLIDLPEVDLPIFGEIFEILRSSKLIVADFLLALEGLSVDYPEQQEVSNRYAHAFWERIKSSGSTH